jgi:hypothetical protein
MLLCFKSLSFCARPVEEPLHYIAFVTAAAAVKDMDLGQIEGIKDQIWQEIRQSIKLSNQTDSFWDNLQAFAHAVDWKVLLAVDDVLQPCSMACSSSSTSELLLACPSR